MTSAVLVPSQITTKAPVRIGSTDWAMSALQDTYESHGLRSEAFCIRLHWFIAFLFAKKYGAMHAILVKDLKRFDAIYILKFLPEQLQDSAGDLWYRLFYGEDLSSDDGRSLFRKTQQDIRRNKNTRNGMKRFRTNTELIEDEAKDATKSKLCNSIFDWKDQGIPIGIFVEAAFKTAYAVAEREQFEFINNVPRYVDDPAGFDDFNDGEYTADNVRASELLQASQQVAPSWQEQDTAYEAKSICLTDLKIAVADAIRILWRPGRKPNASAITELLNKQDEFSSVNHYKVRWVIERLRAELVVEREAAKCNPAPETELEPTEAAKKVKLSATVPEFLQREFARTGPLNETEKQVWGHINTQYPRGLCVNICVRHLPEDTGPWWCTEIQPSVIGIQSPDAVDDAETEMEDTE
jgi:hypothetical protein